MLNLRTAPNTGGGPAHKNDLEEETWAKEAGAPSTVPTQILVAHREQFAIDALAQELAAQATAVLGVTNPADLQTCLARGPQISAAIVDFRLFSASGLDQLRKLLARLGDVPVILFASGLEARVIALALQAGVRGIIPATMPLKAISSVLYLVQLGQVFTGGPPLKNAPGDGQSSRSLTDEEYGVLRRVALGDTNKQIAGEFGVTEVRVKMLMRAICRKIEARNRAHACVIAREQGLL
ncbi:two-component system nitrate/nitrite response regulator NarP [Rhodobacter maris]|uniref:Two-component system nitrate/nitrite response regulator NarP n=2 Tax=Rhodobacter maris TaxID=446682 RepID=A0A285THR7_9RHOB|nr:two-component system nitrate/nitrite response regulator NarP [Rhodobacter maris]